MLPNELLRRAREATGFVEPAHTGRRSSTPDKPVRKVPFALLITGLVVGSLALLLALNTASAANELQRHDLSERDAVVAARLQDLKVEIAVSGAPANLAAAAAALGMVPAGNPAFVVIGADGKARVMGKPEAATEAPVVVKKPKATATPKPSATPTGKPTGKPTATPSPKSSATPTTRSSRTPTAKSSGRPSPGRSSAARSTPRPTPTPKPTPTPVVTLPGGTR